MADRGMREPLLADEDATYREEEEVDFLPVDEMSPGVRRGRPPLSGASSAGRLGGAVVAPNSAPLATTGRGAGFTRSLTDSEDSSNLGGGGSGALALLEGGSPPLRQSRSKRWGQRGRRSARRKDGVQPGSSSPLPDLASRRSPSPYMGGSRTVSTPSPKTIDPKVSSRSPNPSKNSPSRAPYVPQSRDYLYTKVRYYSSLTRMNSRVSPGGKGQILDLSAPAHVLPPHLFGLSDSDDATQSSWQTITSIVNTMMGSTIVAMPYAIAQSGFAAGIGCICVMGLLSCFTCLLVIEHGSTFDDYSDFAGHYLGNKARAIAWFFSVFVILGASMAYHILMAESLFQLVNALQAALHASWSIWTAKAAALAILVLYPVCNLKDFGMLIKFNSAGFLFLWYTILFIFYHGVHGLAGGNFTFVWVPSAAPGNMSDVEHHVIPINAPNASNLQPAAITIIAGADWGVASLFGMMMLSFFVHNVVQPITKHADSGTRKRDLVIAYAIAGFLYAAVGVMGYFGFCDSVLPEITSENFLNIFAADDLYATSARLSLFLQLMTVYPLLLLIIRTQVLGAFYNDVYPGFWQVAGLNGGVMTATTLVACYFGKVTEVLSYTGAIAGLVIVFAVPISVDVIRRKKYGSMTLSKTVAYGAIMTLSLAILVAQFVPLPHSS